MNGRTVPSKLTDAHLGRKAIVYLRQSTDRQVLRNTESLKLQYNLVNRAKEQGFAEVEVIECDLGRSASMGAKRREGFDRLIAAVAVGEVGIVLSREVSRLSRTDKDWCRLVEVCQVFGTLIGDEEQLYDLGLTDDQLILGIKGTMSVVELNVLKLRMQAGMEQKARRGELVRVLPAGYVYDKAGKVVKDPDLRVQQALDLAFRVFRETGSIRKTFLWFRQERIEFPVNRMGGGKVELVWQLPKQSTLEWLFNNPFYAGAYFWGRHPMERIVVEGRVRKRQGKARRPEQCKVFIKGHHEGYIDWQQYERIRAIVSANSLGAGKGGERRGAVKNGEALLSGLLRCGRCGRQLQVRYWGSTGKAGQYYCAGDTQNEGKRCIQLSSRAVDARLSAEVLEAISPLGLEGSLEAIRGLKEEQGAQKSVLDKQLQHLEWEAQRAFEQYDEVDPRNRMVASELERRWNEKLVEVQELKGRIEELNSRTRALTPAQEREIMGLGERFGLVWESEACPIVVKKRIIRTVIEEIVADEQEEQLVLVVHWKGGCHTKLLTPKPLPVSVTRKTKLEDQQIISEMAQRYADGQIACVLNRLGRTTGAGNRWNEGRVKRARKTYGIAGQPQAIMDPEVLTLQQAIKRSGAGRSALLRLIEAGVLKAKQVVPFAPWEIHWADLEAEPVRGILERFKKTGKLLIEGHVASAQKELFAEVPKAPSAL